MAIEVEIVEELYEEIEEKFGGKADEVFSLIKSLEQSPNKGKLLGNIGGILIKELRYKSFRIYFVIDGFKLRIFNGNALNNLLIKFVKMSNKKEQQKSIEEIKKILRNLGEEGF